MSNNRRITSSGNYDNFNEAPVAEGVEADEADYTDGHMGLLGDIPVIRRPRSRKNSVDGQASVVEEKAASLHTHPEMHGGNSYNMFAKRRHYAQTFLDIALLVNNVSHLVSVYLSDDSDLKKTLLALIITSIALQVLAAFLLFHITCMYHLAESRELKDMAMEINKVTRGSMGLPPSQTEATSGGCCGQNIMSSSMNCYETAILVLDGLATGIILIVTILNVFISAFFQLHTNVKTETNRRLMANFDKVVKDSIGNSAPKVKPLNGTFNFTLIRP